MLYLICINKPEGMQRPRVTADISGKERMVVLPLILYVCLQKKLVCKEVM